ncbi:MAG: hypothetical protein ACRELS_09605 [Candidatus Rokuibacteriota bacterium]
MRRFGWLTAALVLFSTTAAWAQDAVAVLTEIQTRRGQVHVRTAGDADWVAPKPLQALRAGDQVRVTGDGRAVLVFTGGRGTQLVTSGNSPFKVDVKADGAATDRAKAVLGNVTNFLLGQQREKTYQSLSVRSVRPQPPVILAPRETLVVAGAPLTIEWMGSDRLRYTVRVIGPQGSAWQQTDIERKPLAYTGPALVAGAKYTLELETKEHGVLRQQFEVLGVDDARRVREGLAVLTPETARGYPASTLALMRAGLLFQEGLYADARRELVAGIAQYPDEATLHLLLGHVYDRTGLKQLAGNEFDEAESLASGR